MHKDYLGYKIRTLSNKLRKQFMSYETLRGIDEVTRMNGWILGHLYDNRNHDIYQKDIEQSFDMCRSTTAGILKSMELKGYINRLSVDSDARLKKLVLTKKGTEIHLQTIKDIDKLDYSLIKDISQNDMDTFYRVLTILGNKADENVSTNFKNIITHEDSNA